jgi:hypothetical protein
VPILAHLYIAILQILNATCARLRPCAPLLRAVVHLGRFLVEVIGWTTLGLVALVQTCAPTSESEVVRRLFATLTPLVMTVLVIAVLVRSVFSLPHGEGTVTQPPQALLSKRRRLLMKRFLGAAVLSLTVAGWCGAATTPTPPPAAPDIPKMAADYTKALGLSGTPVCSTAAVDGTHYSCTVADTTAVFSGPFSFLCGPDAGCFVPLPALAIPASPTK